MESYTVYIHIPYCKKKCRYCSFLSTTPDSNDLDTYIEAARSELKLYGPFLSGRRVKSIYVGGGTPSLLDSRQLKQLLSAVYLSLSVEGDREITIEANPESASLERLKSMHDAGFNRLSIGLQSFDDTVLMSLGRLHDARSSFSAIEKARNAGFHNINADIIYGIPSQDIGKELDGVKALGPEHVSFYYLAVEQGTPLSMDKRFTPLNDEIFEELYLRVHEEMVRMGYEHYEVSNFAKKGFQSVHNMNYWERGDYLGIGSGAHGFFKTGLPWIGMTAQARYENAYPPSAYRGKVSGNDGGSAFPISRVEVLDRDAEILEHIFLSLRTWKGIDTALVKNKTLLKHLTDDGLIRIDNDKLSLTAKGMCVMDGIVTELF
ncbi:MAG: radical SAM family heme chaperone HemW [Deltaproteobacteria bacterium]|nr:radical SAM family heme chaperone HemW [Deltaproteobacteria bacterium]MCL5276384.1 radical SAM family heme chaperone HemW [Deltaproteobacteria bacterium]